MVRVAVVGATGLFGMHFCQAGRALGYDVVAVSRGRSAANTLQLDSLAAAGCSIAFGSSADIEGLSAAFRGCDAVICLCKGVSTVIEENERAVWEAAKKAGVKRFVPDEFGCDTQAMHVGEGALFDAKKRFASYLREHESELPWTIVFCGLIFDYSLPNIVHFNKITMYGNKDLQYWTTSGFDIGIVTMKAIVDPRCKNNCVAIRANQTSQQAAYAKLIAQYPKDACLQDTIYISTDEILRRAEGGLLTDEDKKDPESLHEALERWQINKACYVTGRASYPGEPPHLLDAVKLFPDLQFQSIDRALADPSFVFGVKHSRHLQSSL